MTDSNPPAEAPMPTTGKPFPFPADAAAGLRLDEPVSFDGDGTAAGAFFPVLLREGFGAGRADLVTMKIE
jgi:hypothetical protein